MSFPFIWHYLLIVPHALLVVVLIALLRKHRYKQFPIFFAYVVQEIIQSFVMISLIESPSTTGGQYHIAYTVSLILNTAFYFGILHELFSHIFRNYAALRKFGKPLFGWITVGFLVITLGLAVYTGAYGNQLMFLSYLFDRTAGVLQTGLLICLFLFSSRLGLSWRSHVFGITFGMGILASADLISAAIRSQTGFTYYMALDYFGMVSFHLCVLVWIFYLFAPEKSYAPKALPAHDLESWNIELERLLKQP